MPTARRGHPPLPLISKLYEGRAGDRTLRVWVEPNSNPVYVLSGLRVIAPTAKDVEKRQLAPIVTLTQDHIWASSRNSDFGSNEGLQAREPRLVEHPDGTPIRPEHRHRMIDDAPQQAVSIAHRGDRGGNHIARVMHARHRRWDVARCGQKSAVNDTRPIPIYRYEDTRRRCAPESCGKELGFWDGHRWLRHSEHT